MEKKQGAGSLEPDVKEQRARLRAGSYGAKANCGFRIANFELVFSDVLPLTSDFDL